MPASLKSDQLQRPLKASVNLLGRLLGQVIAQAHGQELLDTIEDIRTLAKTARKDAPESRLQLIERIKKVPSEQVLLVARAFSQFLNMANIAEQLYGTLNTDVAVTEDQISDSDSALGATFQQFLGAGIDKTQILSCVQNLKIELVLTAHPTEITRRTLIDKQNQIFDCLRQLDSQQFFLDPEHDTARPESFDKNRRNDHNKIISRLTQLIAQWWHTDAIRSEKPSPVDEAVWGFAVIENSLWEAVPLFVNQITDSTNKQLAHALPIEFAPIQITSWMGGDRDGNPNVTAKVTEEVIRLARWKAADLFLKDTNQLISELSMHQCSQTFSELYGESREPYRALLKQTRTLLNNTLLNIDDLLKNKEPNKSPILENNQQLWQPLLACYQSLIACGMDIIANGKLLDTLRRVQCFGCFLVRLDIRQESSRHAQVFSELTQYLIGKDYAQWDENQRAEFLSQEITSKRPLIPRGWQPSAEVQEVLDTFKMLALQPRDALGVYIISMAKVPSDVLAVQLLLKEYDCPILPIAPLFETLDDLNHAADVVRALFDTSIYRQSIKDQQMIMIGYSDSAKDAGVMAASWAQYRAQEQLIKLCSEYNVELTLFHGRGGTTGRGGAPAEAALLSQPPGSLKNGLRVTEQGEMIRFKLGLPAKAINTFELYARAMLQSNLTPPPAPKTEWREAVDELASLSAQSYRDMVFHQKTFLDYFHTATPINELSKLPLGSRPAKRKSSGGIESLRAIPWSFAWSQNRLMFPAWYGAGKALKQLIDQGKQALLEQLCQQWPFFSTRISMLEMVYSKTNSELSAYYESRLVDDGLKELGQELRQQLQQDIAVVLSIVNDDHLLHDLPWLKESLTLRDTYIDPLNILQVELLAYDRLHNSDEIEKALMVTVAGIAAGLRNTG